MRTKNTGRLALSAVLTSLAVVVLLLTATPIATIGLAALAGVCGIPIVVEWGRKAGLIHFAAVAALALLLMIVIKPRRYRAYTIYQLVIALLGVLSIFLWVFGMSDVEWPVMAAAGVSLLCFLTMLVFSHRRTGHELKKRFHV